VTIWAFVPARGGSKSIPLKNLVELGGRPLLDYGILAARASGLCSRIVCSTDHEGIAARARDLGVESDARPAHLATDDARVSDVALEWLSRTGSPDIVVLIQPTSPFVRATDVGAVVEALGRETGAASAQTIVRCPHNHHAWNQRDVAAGMVSFHFAAERAKAANKQGKFPSWLFGNVVAARPSALNDPLGFFAAPSVGVPIERPYDMDVDDAADLVVAEALLRSGAVKVAARD
jgi:CMP-N,N'-diacetyllegionaminic acid synthase